MEMHPIQFYDVCICEHEGLTAFPIYFNPVGCVKKKVKLTSVKIGSQVKTWTQSLVEIKESTTQSIFMNSPYIEQALVQRSHVFRKSNYRTQVFKKVNFTSFISLEMVNFSLLITFIIYLHS